MGPDLPVGGRIRDEAQVSGTGGRRLVISRPTQKSQEEETFAGAGAAGLQGEVTKPAHVTRGLQTSEKTCCWT